MEQETWSDDEEERFMDLPAPAEFDAPGTSKDIHEKAVEEETQEDQKTSGPDATPNKVKGSWVHRANFGGKGICFLKSVQLCWSFFQMPGGVEVLYKFCFHI